MRKCLCLNGDYSRKSACAIWCLLTGNFLPQVHVERRPQHRWQQQVVFNSYYPGAVVQVNNTVRSTEADWLRPALKHKLLAAGYRKRVC